MPAFLLLLLQIRLKQAARALRGVGWMLVVALPMAGIFLFVIWDKLAGLAAWQASLLLGVMFLALHIQRKDLAFLRKCHRSVPLIVGIEYQLALLPMSIPVAWLSGSAEILLWSHAAVALIAFLPARRSKDNGRTFQLTFLPSKQFEWLSGVRKQWLILVPIYLAGILLSGYIPGPLLSISFILLIALGFYDELESRMMLESALRSRFLLKKWGEHYRLFCLLLLPQIALFLIFHFQYWYLLLFILANAGILLGCAIFYKYSAYLPGRRSSNSQTPVSLLSLTLIIPFLAPLSLIALFILHRKARRRLQYFFDHAGN